jgi:hypothetical protein
VGLERVQLGRWRRLRKPWIIAHPAAGGVVNESYRVPKRAIEVLLCNRRGEAHGGEIFVMDPHGDARGERLQDVLATRRFFPIVREGSVEFWNSEAVSWLRVDLLSAIGELDLQSEDADESVESLVRVDLADGSHLEGNVRYLLPPESRRLSDYLELVGRQLLLRTDEHLYLISIHAILHVRPLGVKADG